MIILGWILVFIGFLWLLAVAFKESFLWGIGCIVLPIITVIFLIMHFKISWKPALVHTIGVIILLLSGFHF